MNKNIRIAKQLVKIARSLVALDEEGDGSGFQGLIDHEKFEQDELDRAEKEGKKYILYRKEQGLWRIMACKDFDDVKKGDFGGFVSSEENLSHEGNCWIYGYGNAWVCGNAKVYDNAKVFYDAKVCDHAKVYGNAEVYGHQAKVYGNAEVYDNAKVHDRAEVHGDAKVYGDADVYSDAKVYDRAEVYGDASVHGDARVYGDAKVYSYAFVTYDVSEGKTTE